MTLMVNRWNYMKPDLMMYKERISTGATGAKIMADCCTNFFTTTNLSNKAMGWFSKERGVYRRGSLQYLYPDEFK